MMAITYHIFMLSPVSTGMFFTVTEARYLDTYRVRLRFEDGSTGVAGSLTLLRKGCTPSRRENPCITIPSRTGSPDTGSPTAHQDVSG